MWKVLSGIGEPWNSPRTYTVWLVADSEGDWGFSRTLFDWTFQFHGKFWIHSINSRYCIYPKYWVTSFLFTSYSLRKHAYSNILKILTPKNENFQIKNPEIFHISARNIDCGYSLEPPRWGGSNEYPQSLLLSRNKKHNVYPFKPQFKGMFSWCKYRVTPRILYLKLLFNKSISLYVNVSIIAVWVANSVHPDKTPCSVASDLDLLCLLRSVCQNTYSKYGYLINFNPSPSEIILDPPLLQRFFANIIISQK